MAGDERKRRKQRPSERRAEMAARTEEKNREARDRLEPLGKGERPAVVSVGAVISAVVAVSILVAYAAGSEVNGERPALLSVIAPALLMGVMAYGMWRARYWAVLGFQALLVLLLLAATLGLVGAVGIAQVVGNLILIGIAGTLFFLMVKAMARIQMPERRPRE